MPALPARARYGPGIAAGILITSMLLPPVAVYARQYAYAQALQFLIFAVAGPALLVLGTPWRSRPPAWRPGSGGRRGGPGGRAAIRLVGFIAVVIGGAEHEGDDTAESVGGDQAVVQHRIGAQGDHAPFVRSFLFSHASRSVAVIIISIVPRYELKPDTATIIIYYIVLRYKLADHAGRRS